MNNRKLPLSIYKQIKGSEFRPDRGRRQSGIVVRGVEIKTRRNLNQTRLKGGKGRQPPKRPEALIKPPSGIGELMEILR